MPKMSLLNEFSKKLAESAEKNDALVRKLTYTEDQLALSQAQISLLEAQVKLFKDAQHLRQGGDQLNTKQSNNPFTLTGSRKAVANSQQSKVTSTSSLTEEEKTTTDTSSTPSA